MDHFTVEWTALGQPQDYSFLSLRDFGLPSSSSKSLKLGMPISECHLELPREVYKDQAAETQTLASVLSSLLRSQRSTSSRVSPGYGYSSWVMRNIPQHSDGCRIQNQEIQRSSLQMGPGVLAMIYEPRSLTP